MDTNKQQFQSLEPWRQMLLEKAINSGKNPPKVRIPRIRREWKRGSPGM